MGVIGMLAPESAGGLGLTFVDLVLVLEETGRFAVPEPIVETAAWGVPLLGRTDLTDRGGRALGPVGRHRRRDLHRGRPLRARRAWSSSPARRSTAPAACSRCTARPAPVDGRGVLAAYDRGVCGIAAQQCGLADRMLEMTADYVRERRQFGVPVGSFQAVKHHLANARIALEFARPLVYRAAASIAAGDPDTERARVDGQGQGRRRRARDRPGRAPVPRRDRLHDRVRPAPLPEALVGTRPRVGATRSFITTASPARSCSHLRPGAARCPRPTSSTRCAARSAGAAARSPACTRPTSARTRSARSWTASTSIPPPSTTSCSAASTRSARRPATSRARAGSSPASPTKCRARPSTGSADRRNRPCTSRRRR